MTLVLESLPLRNARLKLALSGLLFVLIVSKAWDSAFIDALRRLNDLLDATQGRGSRVVLMGVVCLALARFMLVTVALYVMLSFVVTLAMYAAVYTNKDVPVLKWWRSAALAGPAPWYHFFHPHHLKVHAAVVGGGVLLGMLQVVLYVRDEDLEDAASVRSKAARVLMGLAVLTIVAYLVYIVVLLAHVGTDSE